MVIRHIYDRDQQLSPGALTMLKVNLIQPMSSHGHLFNTIQGAMVSNSALAAVSVWSGLHEYLLFESSPLEYGIRSYVNELKDKKEKEYELATQEGRSPGQYWLEIEPPKVRRSIALVVSLLSVYSNFRLYQTWWSLSSVLSTYQTTSPQLEQNRFLIMSWNHFLTLTSRFKHFLTTQRKYCLNCCRHKAANSLKSRKTKTIVSLVVMVCHPLSISHIDYWQTT